MVAVIAGTNTEDVTQLIVNGIDSNGSAFNLTQNMPDNSGTTLAQTAVLHSITINGSTVLNDFDFLTPKIDNLIVPMTGGIIEVYSNGTAIERNASNFRDGIASMHSDGDLASYIRVDGTSVNPSWNLNYGTAIDKSGYFIVQERNGNTNFNLTPLDANGVEIGNTLLFDAPSYEWDTSIKFFQDTTPADQTQELSVIDLDLFDTTEDIFGFRVVNTGNADFKFFFGNVANVPEPNSCTLLALGLGVCILRRRIRK